MNTPRYAAAAASLIRRHLPTEVANTVDHQAGIASVERGLRARARRRRLRQLTVAFAAAAALVLGLLLSRFGGGSKPTRGAVVNVSPSRQGATVRGGRQGPRVLAARTTLEVGQRIETPVHGGASLDLSTGTSMVLSGRSSLSVDSPGPIERFSLQHGELSAHVAKVTSAHRFIVSTPDTEVEVRGTRFRLRVLDQGEACGAGTRTRLEVTEGAVEVRVAGTKVAAVLAGQSWPPDCGAAAEQVVRGPAEVHSAAPVRNRAVPVKSDPATPERESALLPVNDLFAQGLERRRRGDVPGALRVYEELLTRFPESALAENAMVERMRLLASARGAKGRSEAKRYLARYPRGFALEEAQRLVAEP